ncbi:MAG: hypothetical protein LIP05_04410, partial [Tannerellaceae bacterium]|nr:hypothetical protein [Tannerellaceae bacterium]
ISSVRGDALKDVPSVSFDQMLQGRASGVSITTPLRRCRTGTCCQYPWSRIHYIRNTTIVCGRRHADEYGRNRADRWRYHGFNNRRC